MGIVRLAWRLARQTFHEVTGTVFLLFGAVGGYEAAREWHNPGGHWIAWMGAGYAVLMCGYGVMAFRDSRRAR